MKLFAPQPCFVRLPTIVKSLALGAVVDFVGGVVLELFAKADDVVVIRDQGSHQNNRSSNAYAKASNENVRTCSASQASVDQQLVRQVASSKSPPNQRHDDAQHSQVLIPIGGSTDSFGVVCGCTEAGQSEGEPCVVSELQYVLYPGRGFFAFDLHVVSPFWMGSISKRSEVSKAANAVFGEGA